MSKFLVLFLIIFYCCQTKNAIKDIEKKRVAFIFGQGYDNDTLTFYINDSMISNPQITIKTNPSLGIAKGYMQDLCDEKIRARVVLNSNRVFDSVLYLKNMSSYIFLYDRTAKSIALKSESTIRMYD